MPEPDAVEPSNLMRLSKYQPEAVAPCGWGCSRGGFHHSWFHHDRLQGSKGSVGSFTEDRATTSGEMRPVLGALSLVFSRFSAKPYLRPKGAGRSTSLFSELDAGLRSTCLRPSSFE